MLMVPLVKEVMYVEKIPNAGSFMLAADIGGTNSNFGVFILTQEKPILLVSLHYKSQKVTDFSQLFKQVRDSVIERYAINLKQACIAAAGVIRPTRFIVKPTNLSIVLDVRDIEKVSGLSFVFLINDFEAVALGHNLINKSDIISIRTGTTIVHGTKAFLGAGTGLGKSMFVWSTHDRQFVPVASEGGHADVVVYTAQEARLVSFIQNENKLKCPISWEDVLSGNGIQRIYRFLGSEKEYPSSDISAEIAASDVSPDRISYYAQHDERCKDTFNLYAIFYARCARNFVLESLSLGGIYIAGGIAAKNIALFSSGVFLQELTTCGKHSKLVAQVPFYIIADYNVSLYGAVVAAQYHRLDLM